MKSLFSTTLKGVLVLILLDIILVWVWAINEDLGPGSAMIIYLAVPFVFIVNLIIGGILVFTKRAYCTMFFVNCIIASVITYWIFTYELSNQSRGRYEEWIFNTQDTTFRINKSNEYNEFSMSYSTDPGSSTVFIMGQYLQKHYTLLLRADSITMYIHNFKLYNFRHSKVPITLRAY